MLLHEMDADVHHGLGLVRTQPADLLSALYLSDVLCLIVRVHGDVPLEAFLADRALEAGLGL